MTAEFSSVPLNECLRQRLGDSPIVDASRETFVTVRLHGKGAVRRNIEDGKTPRMARGLRVCAGDLIFSRIDARNGAFAIIPDELAGAVVSKDFPCFEIVSERVDARYLSAFLTSESFYSQLQQESTGSTNRQRIKEETFLAFRVPLPPLPEQRRIVGILEEAEKLRALRQQADRRTADLIPALFHEMFGDPATNPKGWPVSDVSACLAKALRNGTSPSKRGHTTAKVLILSAITGDRFNDTEVKEATFAAPPREEDRVSIEDLYVCRGSGNRAMVGAGRFAERRMPDTAFPDTMIAVRPEKSVLEREYFEAVWNHSVTRAQLSCAARTTNGTFKINHDIVGAVRIPLPPLPLQKQFAAAVAGIRAMQEKQSASRRRLDDLYQSLLHRAFRGEL